MRLDRIRVGLRVVVRSGLRATPPRGPRARGVREACEAPRWQEPCVCRGVKVEGGRGGGAGGSSGGKALILSIMYLVKPHLRPGRECVCAMRAPVVSVCVRCGHLWGVCLWAACHEGFQWNLNASTTSVGTIYAIGITCGLCICDPSRLDALAA